MKFSAKTKDRIQRTLDELEGATWYATAKAYERIGDTKRLAVGSAPARDDGSAEVLCDGLACWITAVRGNELLYRDYLPTPAVAGMTISIPALALAPA